MQSVFAQPVVQYGKFWPRVGAQLLDMLVLLPITLPLSIYNITDWKSDLILILLSVIGIGYRIFMEHKYGATLGKMAVQLKIVNYDLEKASLSHIVRRNLLYIIIAVMSVVSSLIVFHTDGFADIETYGQYNDFIAENELKSGLSGLFMFVIILVDCIFLWSDDHKRSLHDRIGKTLVVDKFTDPSILQTQEQGPEQKTIY